MREIKKIGTKRRGYTRRQVLKGMGIGAFAVAASPLIAACAPGTEESASTSEEVALSGPLNFSNWPFYIDESPGTLKQFEEEFGVNINYIEDINDNEEFFATIEPQLSKGEDIGRDIIVLTDWMADRLIKRGWIESLDKTNIPNWENMRDGLKNVAFDPGRQFSLVWQSGFTAIGYNPKLTDRELTKIEDIFDPAFAGHVSMLTEMRDTIGLTMLAMGRDPSNATVDDAQAAVDMIQEFIDNDHIRRFTGNDYGAELSRGDTWVSYAWSGDVIQLKLDNPDLEWLFPEEGFMLWSDNMLIPKNAANKRTAEAYMNFYYRPDVQAAVEAFVQFIPPVKFDLVKEEIARIDPELVDNPLIFPGEADVAKAHVFKPLDEEEEKEFNRLFEQLTL
jgi:spermidine/putrescine transport system substrate-binding protein